MKIIESGIPQLRDPFMLIEDGVFYLYGTGWVCYRNTTGKLDSGWEDAVEVVEVPEDYKENKWAPEVYKYNGAFYMFTTYLSKNTEKRGCAVFKADNPMGPFKLYSDGAVTPKDSHSIDGSLYIDQQKNPWMVYVNEWVDNFDGMGRFSAARMSDDLNKFITEPFDLFKSNSFEWSNRNVTDGCYLYETKNNSLLMLWSNFDKNNEYAVALVRSDNGKIDGNWSHDKMLYSKELSGNYDGGHGMIFELDGKKYLSIHSPNLSVGDRKEMPVFIEIEEQDDSIILKE